MKYTFPSFVSLLGLGLLTVGLTATPAHAQSKDDLIKNALSAATETIAKNATVVDGAGNVLREGTNGYVCLPDDPRPGVARVGGRVGEPEAGRASGSDLLRLHARGRCADEQHGSVCHRGHG